MFNEYRRAMSGKSRKAAIRCHCLMCCGWVRKEVELCTATGCPLYLYRPKFKAKPPGDMGVIAPASP